MAKIRMTRAAEAVLLRQHQWQADKLRRRVAAQIESAIANPKSVERQLGDTGRQDYLSRCSTLRAQRDEQWKAMRSSWRDDDAERKEAIEEARMSVRSRERDRDAGTEAGARSIA
jgi:hypothetical protein